MALTKRDAVDIAVDVLGEWIPKYVTDNQGIQHRATLQELNPERGTLVLSFESRDDYNTVVTVRFTVTAERVT
jgi:hypothetical protein